MLLVALLHFLVLTAAALAKPNDEAPLAKNANWIPPQFEPPSYTATIIYPSIRSVYPVQFVKAGQPAIQTFLFTSPAVYFVVAYDCYCAGDLLDFYVNGQLRAAWLQTSACYQDAATDLTCANYSEESEGRCFTDEAIFCKRAIRVEVEDFTPGPTVNLTIVPSRTPYGPGVGYLFYYQ